MLGHSGDGDRCHLCPSGADSLKRLLPARLPRVVTEDHHSTQAVGQWGEWALKPTHCSIRQVSWCVFLAV